VFTRELLQRAHQRCAGHASSSVSADGSRRASTMRRFTSSPKADVFRGSGGRGLTKCAENGTNRLALRRSELQRVRPNGRRGPIRAPRQIDALDQGIIEALQANGRESFRRIATRLGVSEATIRARYTRLSGFEQALVGVKTSGAPQPAADEIASWREADYVVVTAGQYDIIVELVAADRRELLELTNRIRALDGVVSTETFLYLDMVKQLYDWGTHVDGDTT